MKFRNPKHVSITVHVAPMVYRPNQSYIYTHNKAYYTLDSSAINAMPVWNTTINAILHMYIQTIVSRRNEYFATTKIVTSSVKENATVTKSEKISHTPDGLKMIDHDIPRYYYEVLFKVRENPSSRDQADYDFLYNVIQAAFKIFCYPE